MSILFEDQLCCTDLSALELPVAAAAVLGNVVDCGVVVWLLSLIWFRTWPRALLVVGFAVNLGLNQLLKYLFASPRPAGSCLAGFDFPSGEVQTIAYLAVYTALTSRIGVFNRWILAFAVIAEAVSRVALGHHTIPAAVAGGILGGLFGLGWALLVRRRRHKNEDS